MAIYTQPEQRHVMISISKRNRRYMDILDDFCLEKNLTRSQGFFELMKEYDTFRCLSVAYAEGK